MGNSMKTITSRDWVKRNGEIHLVIAIADRTAITARMQNGCITIATCDVEWFEPTTEAGWIHVASTSEPDPSVHQAEITAAPCPVDDLRAKYERASDVLNFMRLLFGRASEIKDEDRE